jgi:putative FmdB family regulatory protein
MPTYEYECEGCGRRFDRRQNITEAPLDACPACGGTVRRLLSGGAGILVRGGDRHGGEGHGGGCSLERTGATCCGRTERCEQSPCEDKR